MNWLPPVATDLRAWVIVFLVVLVGVFVRAILKGDLVPRDRVTELIQERDSWRKAHELSEQTRAIMANQVDKLLSTSELTNQLLLSLKDTKDRP